MTLQLQDVTDEYTVGVLPYASTKLNFEFNIVRRARSLSLSFHFVVLI
jgi:hypothetical protein